MTVEIEASRNGERLEAMARPSRIDMPDGICQVTTRGLGWTSGAVTAQAISKAARQVAHRRQREGLPDRAPARIEPQLHKK